MLRGSRDPRRRQRQGRGARHDPAPRLFPAPEASSLFHANRLCRQRIRLRRLVRKGAPAPRSHRTRAGEQIVDEVAPHPGELVIRKTQASASSQRRRLGSRRACRKSATRDIGSLLRSFTRRSGSISGSRSAFVTSRVCSPSAELQFRTKQSDAGRIISDRSLQRNCAVPSRMRSGILTRSI
jgi:hypothetical protein